jgi:hypothetical protein
MIMEIGIFPGVFCAKVFPAASENAAASPAVLNTERRVTNGVPPATVAF